MLGCMYTLGCVHMSPEGTSIPKRTSPQPIDSIYCLIEMNSSAFGAKKRQTLLRGPWGPRQPRAASTGEQPETLCGCMQLHAATPQRHFLDLLLQLIQQYPLLLQQEGLFCPQQNIFFQTCSRTGSSSSSGRLSLSVSVRREPLLQQRLLQQIVATPDAGGRAVAAAVVAAAALAFTVPSGAAIAVFVSHFCLLSACVLPSRSCSYLLLCLKCFLSLSAGNRSPCGPPSWAPSISPAWRHCCDSKWRGSVCRVWGAL